jgi:hypothetical protein
MTAIDVSDMGMQRGGLTFNVDPEEGPRRCG